MRNLNKQLKLLGISKKDLAKELGISASAITSWSKGNKHPSVPMLIKTSQILECTTDYLLGLTDKPQNKKNARLDDLEIEIINAYREADEVLQQGVHRLLNISMEKYKNPAIVHVHGEQETTRIFLSDQEKEKLLEEVKKAQKL